MRAGRNQDDFAGCLRVTERLVGSSCKLVWLAGRKLALGIKIALGRKILAATIAIESSEVSKPIPLQAVGHTTSRSLATFLLLHP